MGHQWQKASGHAAHSETQPDYRTRLRKKLNVALEEEGYSNPPHPTPLVVLRAVARVAKEAGDADLLDTHRDAISAFAEEQASEYKAATKYLSELAANLAGGLLSSLLKVLGKTHPSIAKATLSSEIPDVPPALKQKLLEVEQFLGGDWRKNDARGVLAIHVDEEAGKTIIQIGIARHGPIYLTIPAILKPEDMARSSLRELLSRLKPFKDDVDPLAVVDGQYQDINFSELFKPRPILRAITSDTRRLRRNIGVSDARSRLAPENTSIINSAPRSQPQYSSVFPADRNATGWTAWSGEAASWDRLITNEGFAVTAEASQAALLRALSESKNVVVLMAHCDGESLFMPEPPPNGTQVTTAYLREHAKEISANAPFVCLFACHGADLSRARNFAAALLDAGASGVIAAQGPVGGARGQELLTRLIGKNRGAPPIDDFQRAARELDNYDMEVFLA